MRLRDPAGGVITVERPYLPFTPTEFARARALVELDARLGPRVPRGQDVLTLPRGQRDHRAARRRERPGRGEGHARALLDRAPSRCATTARSATPTATSTICSARASAARSPSRRRPGGSSPSAICSGTATRPRSRCSSRTTGSAAASAPNCCAGWCRWPSRPAASSVYAVTQSSNTGMVAAMRGLGLPLDYQIEEGTLVITARLDTAPVASPRSYDHSARDCVPP